MNKELKEKPNMHVLIRTIEDEVEFSNVSSVKYFVKEHTAFVKRFGRLSCHMLTGVKYFWAEDGVSIDVISTRGDKNEKKYPFTS